MKAAETRRDAELSLHGSIGLLRPLTPRAQAWIEENVSDEALSFGGALAVEPRYVPAILRGMLADGFAVFIGESQVATID